MALRDDWKKTGKGFGSAFKGLGKNIGRTVKTGLDAADDSLPEDGSTVFNDGSWRKMGKDMGGAFTSLGKSIVRSAKKGLDKIDGGDDEKALPDGKAIEEQKDE